MSDTPNLDWLREEVRKLKALLDDPHPGLITWCQMYGDQMNHIVEFWNPNKLKEDNNAKSE